MNACIFMYICMYIRMYACMYAYMYVCLYIKVTHIIKLMSVQTVMI